MKNLKLVVLFCISLSTSVVVGQKRYKKQAEADTQAWRYEILCEGVGNQGEYLVKVFTFSKKKDVAIEQAKKNAIHGVIFKGVPSSKRGCVSQPPLVQDANAEEQKRAYFDSFFQDGGKYMKYVNLTTSGAVKASDRFVVNSGGMFKKKTYKIGLIVSVNKDQLRKELEAAGVIKKLSSGF